MEKSELKTGMLVELRSGQTGVVLLGTKDGDIIGSDGPEKFTAWFSLSFINDDLTYKDMRFSDIVKVYGFKSFMRALVDKNDRDLLWERVEERYVELLRDNCGYKKCDVAKVVEDKENAYIVFVDNRFSDSDYSPNVWYPKSWVVPSTKEAYEAQFKVNELTIEQIEKLTGLKNVKIIKK